MKTTKKQDAMTGEEKRVARMRAKGLSFRKIEEKLGREGNGSWALRVTRRLGLA
jgi:hypothetical protein